jgi:serine/threonine protein kinase
MRPVPGDLIGGKYRVVRVIGDGGMGTVYEARHEVLGTAVALKFLHAELAKRAGLAQRFLQEARVSANIQSIHVTRVTDVDMTPDGTPYLVMELLHGESLQQLLDRRGKLPPHEAIDFALQTLAGLEAAHALGVVHRDLKPDNVFVTPSSGGPLLKLIDFGIAKLRASNEYQRGLTRAGALMGTPEYMAPEQLYSAADVDHRADIFSLGVMLFEMLSARRPADGEDAPAIVGKVMAGEILRLDACEPELPPGLVAVVHRAIAAERDERFASAHELRLALAPFAGELSHAGRLAATPHPAAVSQLQLPDIPLSTRDTSDERAQPSHVPRTLPPNEAPAPPNYAAAPSQAAKPYGPTSQMPQQGYGAAPSQVPQQGYGAAPSQVPQQGYGAPPSFVAPGYAPPGYDPLKGATEDAPPLFGADTVNERGSTEAAAPAIQVAGQPGVSGPWPTPSLPTSPPRRRSRAAAGIFAVLLGALVTGAVVAGVVWHRRNQSPVAQPDATPPPLTTLTALSDQPTAAPTTPTAPPPATTVVVTPSRPTATAAPKPQPTSTSTAAPGDTGAKPVPTFPPFTLPSALPSTLPPLPSGFPTALPTTLPTAFPPLFPGQSTGQPDAG